MLRGFHADSKGMGQLSMMERNMKNSDILRGVAIVFAVVASLFVGALALSDNGVRKVSCAGRAVVSGVALSNIHGLCGF